MRTRHQIRREIYSDSMAATGPLSGVVGPDDFPPVPQYSDLSGMSDQEIEAWVDQTLGVAPLHDNSTSYNIISGETPPKMGATHMRL